MRFQIMQIFTEEQWDLIDKAALDIIENTGLLVPHSAILEVLGSMGGVHVDGEVVRYEMDIVRDQIQGIEGCTEYDTHLIAGAYSHNYLDPETNKIRPSNTDDLIRSVRQADALGLGVCAPVVPLDVPGPKQELVMERITHENARFSYGAGQATTLLTAEAALEMSSLVGRPHGLELWVNSPLKLDFKNLDIIWQLRHLKPKVRVCNMPVRGMSGTIFLPGLMAQSIAECFGAITTLRLLDITDQLSYRIDAFTSYPVDMHSGNVLLNGPDYLKVLLLTIFLGKRHGISVPAAKALLTSAKKPGIQAAAEKAAQGLAVSLVGADVYMSAGALSIVEIFSPTQMIIDREILSFVDVFAAPFDFSEEDFSLEVIDSVGPGGTFFDHESTVRNCRDVFWNPELFSMNPLNSWVAEGAPSVLDKATDILNSLQLREEPVVTPQIQKELAKIEHRFSERLLR